MLRPLPVRALLTAIALAALSTAAAQGAVAPAGSQTGRPIQAAVPAHAAAAHGGDAPCNVGIPIIGGAVSALTNAACSAGAKIANGVGSVVSGVGNAILDGIASWLIGAATAVTKFVAVQMRSTTTPQLQSSWYEAQFAPIAALGAALALLVTLVALGSAALRRSPDALAGTLVAVVRAGFGTGVIVALTAIGLGIADAISADILQSSPHAFWSTVSTAWGQRGFGGFGSSALAALIALVEVFGALLVWLELIVRNAVIYIAVLFFPVALAASIWPPLAGWTGRLGRLLLFVMLKPVTLIVLSLAGNAAASGLSFSAGAGASVGTILAAVVIFSLAAFAPWALMYLLSADAESAWTGGALRAGTGNAVGGTQGRSLRTGGGLANLRSGRSGGGGSSGGADGSAGGGSPGGGGASDGGDTQGPGSPGVSGDQGGSAAGGASAGANGGAAAAAGAIGGGSVAAASGMHSAATRAGRAVTAADSGGATTKQGAHARGASNGGGAQPDGAGAAPRDRAAAPVAQPAGRDASPPASGGPRGGGASANRGGDHASPTNTAPPGGRPATTRQSSGRTTPAGSRASGRPPRSPTPRTERRT